jgi:predicted nucleotidyltransferase
MIGQIVEMLRARQEVHAIALGGSRASSMADPGSDYDIYVYLDGDVPLDAREALARRFDPAPEIGNTWFGPGDEWTDAATGTAVDVVYWQRNDFERQLRDVIERHRPSLGYSTSFWYTVRHSVPLYDRNGWFATLQALAEVPYPAPLREAIVRWNHPLLRTTHSSWRHQIELAIARDDPVSVNHRVTALLQSATDIIFALHRTLHPGEKRLLSHIAGLEGASRYEYAARIRALLRATADPAEGDLLGAIDALCDAIDANVREAGLHHLTVALGSLTDGPRPGTS